MVLAAAARLLGIAELDEVRAQILGRLANRSPAPAGTLPNPTMGPDDTLNVDVSQAFVDPDDDALTHTVSSSAPQVVRASVTGALVMLAARSEGAATIRVTATDPGGLSAVQSFTVTVATSPSAPFTDHPIRPGVTPVKAVHFTELRARIDALRRVAGLQAFPWTDEALRTGVTPIRLAHLQELREALADAYEATGRAAPGWTDASPATGSTPIRAAHVMEAAGRSRRDRGLLGSRRGRRAVRPRPRPLCRLPRLSARPRPPAASTLGSTGPAARGCDPRRLPRRAPRPKGVVSSNASMAAAGACFRARLAREPSVGRRLQEDIDELRAPVVDEVAVARRS